MSDVINKLQKILDVAFDLWRMDKPENLVTLTDAEAMKAAEAVLSCMDILRYRGRDSDVQTEIQTKFYHQILTPLDYAVLSSEDAYVRRLYNDTEGQPQD